MVEGVLSAQEPAPRNIHGSRQVPEGHALQPEAQNKRCSATRVFQTIAADSTNITNCPYPCQQILGAVPTGGVGGAGEAGLPPSWEHLQAHAGLAAAALRPLPTAQCQERTSHHRGQDPVASPGAQDQRHLPGTAGSVPPAAPPLLASPHRPLHSAVNLRRHLQATPRQPCHLCICVFVFLPRRPSANTPSLTLHPPPSPAPNPPSPHFAQITPPLRHQLPREPACPETGPSEALLQATLSSYSAAPGWWDPSLSPCASNEGINRWHTERLQFSIKTPLTAEIVVQ